MITNQKTGAEVQKRSGIMFGKLFAYLMILPAELLMIAFLIYPAIASFEFSLQSYNLIKPDAIKFIGLDNYLRIFRDPALRIVIFNSAYILIVTVTLSFVCSISIASILNRSIRGRNILLAIVILPWALPSVVNALLWNNIFSPLYGALNGLLYGLGLIDQYIVWTNSSIATLNIIILILLWKTLPILSVIVLAAMQAIPEDLYEAARMDGANTIKCFRYVTLPSIMPSLAIVLSISSIIALNVFDEIYVLARYRSDTRSLAMEAYMQAFRFLDLGFGSAIAYVLLLGGALTSLVYMRNLFREIRSSSG